ncbi:MAG: hydantoinase/oxoprolinase family protein [Alphaproteobacteria bacterium]|nr:hydantoinase/oxoprolinase family protein [Alphaproteobacteria bacterium]
MSRYILAIDVGGTFTDVICYDTTNGAVTTAKVPSTPPDFIDGMLDGITALGHAPRDLRLIKIGTTIATNTIIMRTGAKTALVTTAGFTDVIHAARAARPTLYDSDWDPAPSLVTRQDTLTIGERLTYEGEVVEPLDEAGLRKLAAALKARGAEAVAISFLHSYINGAHERRARDILNEELPGRYVCVSSEILPEIREFERTSTTVANAYLGPVLERYLSALLTKLEGIGYKGAVLITHSGGGVMSIEAARRIPARICQSGPAAGVVAGAEIGKAAGRPNVIGLDVGGTSADVSLSKNGNPMIRGEWNIEFNIVINFPSVDVATIGAGGGSIARVDQGGVLKVGPDSAGARPGPACYGRGGVEPTVTDANLILGRLSPETKLGGRVVLRRDLAESALDKVAAPLGYKHDEAAAGILRIMRANMASAIRLVSVKRGHDPREFALVAFGGAGPLHAVELARELGIPEVIVPYYPGLGSALGVLFVEVKHDFVQSIFATNRKFDLATINDAFRKLEADGRERLRREGVPADRIRLTRLFDVRFYGRVSGGLTLPVRDGALSEADIHEIFALFHKRHAEEYGYTLPEDLTDLELVNARISAEGLREAPPAPNFPKPPSTRPQPFARRSVYFEDSGRVDTPIWRRDTLPIGHTVEGPAIIEQNDTTTLLPPGTRATVDSQQNLLCTIG